MIPQPPPGQGPIDPRGAFSPPPPPPQPGAGGGGPIPPPPPPGRPYPNPAGYGAPPPPPPPPPPGRGMAPGPYPAPGGPWMPMPYPPPMGPPRRSGWRTAFVVLLVLGLGLSILINLVLIVANVGSSAAGGLQTVIAPGDADQRIAVLPINGLIDERQFERFNRFMHRAEEDKNIKALVLEVDSPGGTVTASDEIYARIERFKQKKKEQGATVPVVVSMRELAASGGYYVSCAADYLVAERTALTGNIGVYSLSYNFKNMMDKIGVQDDTIVSTGTPYKYAGSGTRVPTTQDVEYFQHNVDVVFQQFKDVVKAGRGKNLKQSIDQIANGKAYPAQDAKDLGLIDQVGYLEDALKYASTAAGLKNPQVVKYQEPTSFLSMLNGDSDSKYSGRGISINIDPAALEQLATPRMMYLYRK